MRLLVALQPREHGDQAQGRQGQRLLNLLGAAQPAVEPLHQQGQKRAQHQGRVKPTAPNSFGPGVLGALGGAAVETTLASASMMPL